jgi:multicomponent Na+:H+ antiporter subunit E
MSPFLSHILLSLAWVALTGEFTVANLTVGFLLGALVLWLVERKKRLNRYLNRLRHLATFIPFFLVELVTANLRVTFDVLTLRHRMRPGILAVPLDLDSDIQIMVLAGLMTLTPGSLCLDISADRRTMYVHVMYMEDAEEMRRKIKDAFEHRVREVMR